MDLSLETVPPSRMTVPSHFGNTSWRNHETETVARNIVILSRRNGAWLSFTWNQYKQLCRHTPCQGERDCLERLVKDGSLTLFNGVYTPTDRFVQVLSEYVRED